METIMKISNFKILFSHFLIFLFLPFTGIAFSSGYQMITAERVYAMIKDGSPVWLIDVRGPASFDEAHIEGAINISPIALSVKTLPKQKTLVLIDDSLGQREAREAADILIKKGHTRVYIMSHGVLAWEVEGYPVAAESKKKGIRNVMAHDLKWALENAIPLTIFDMRGGAEFTKGSIQGAALVEGKDVQERIKKLNEMIHKQERKDLAKRLEKDKPILLIFSASDDAQSFAEKLVGKNIGIRYLQGGYEAWVAMDGKRVKKSVGDCPVCPLKEQKK